MALPDEVGASARVPRVRPYAQAVRVGDLGFTAGQPGIDPRTGQGAGATFEAQARQAFANLRAVLEDAGSRLERAVQLTCYVADAGAFGTLNALLEAYFPESPPARSTPVVALPRELLFSVDAIAIAERPAPGPRP